MPAIELPSGRYLTCPVDVSPDAGGQTRALLMRNRLFVSEAGISPMVLSFSARTDLARRRETLLDRGLIVPEIATPNIYEHYREHGWGPEADAAEPRLTPIPVDHLRRREDTYDDGTPWRISYRNSSGRPVVYDYLRADGAPFLRVPNFLFREPRTWPGRVQRLGAGGRVLGQWGSVGGFFKRWLRDLTEGERSFVMVDSRYSAQHVIPMKAPHIHLVYVLHNIHVLPPRLWSSKTTDMYTGVLERVDGMDAMVTLTARQRDDIAMRRGRTEHQFVIPNPVDMPAPVPDRRRDPDLVAVVARLENQKKLTHAIRAFARVREQVPTARMDIYGKGASAQLLQREIDRLGLHEAVTLKGHDPHARDALWSASAFLMTSAYEGYPLSTLESMSHGCPVVSYDIKYGPREQITDGVDGFLVPSGDYRAMADRVVEMLRSPELVARMSVAATAKAACHDKAAFVRSWQDVLRAVVDLKPRRTTLDEVFVDAERVRVVPAGSGRRLKSRKVESGPLVHPQDELLVKATVRVRGRSQASDLSSALFTLAAVHEPTGHLHDLPVSVHRDGDTFTVTAAAPVAAAVVGAPDDAAVQLRLQLVWENSTWQAFLGRPQPETDSVEVSYDEAGTLRLQAVPGAGGAVS